MNKQAFLTIASMIIIFSACQKTEEPSVKMFQEVFFNITEVDPTGFKSIYDFACSYDAAGNLKIPTVAEVTINGVTYHAAVYFLNGKLYTQSIKLEISVGDEISYNVSWFALLETNGGDVLMAIPQKDSFYAAYVNKGVDFDISVTPFGKTEVPVQVLCYAPESINLFGFESFMPSELIAEPNSGYFQLN